jgi:hypothetical protein
MRASRLAGADQYECGAGGTAVMAAGCLSLPNFEIPLTGGPLPLVLSESCLKDGPAAEPAVGLGFFRRRWPT